MYNLVMKDFKLGINPWFLAMPFFIRCLNAYSRMDLFISSSVFFLDIGTEYFWSI